MTGGKALILYDGICNLCSGSVGFILKKDKKKQFRFVALQSEEGLKLIQRFQIPKAVDSVILIKKDHVFIESDAAIEICKLLPSPYKWFTIFKSVPEKWRDKIYSWVAKNRYSWFGKKNQCCYFEEG